MLRDTPVYLGDVYKHLKNNIDEQISNISEIDEKGELYRFHHSQDKIIDNKKVHTYIDREGNQQSYKSTWHKSKLKDLVKLGIIKYSRPRYKDLHITYLGEKLLGFYRSDDQENLKKALTNLMGTYNHDGFRPFAFLIRVLNRLFNEEYITIEFFKKTLSTKIEYFFEFTDQTIDKVEQSQIIEEQVRPASYIINHLSYSGLIDINGNKEFRLNTKSKDFIKMYFSDGVYDLDELGQEPRQSVRDGRQGQSEFRNKILDAYNYRCAITGNKLKYKNKPYTKVLTAAHIYPVCAGGSNDVSNGMPLLEHLHKLFDEGAFTIEPVILSDEIKEYKIILSNQLIHENIFPSNMILNNLPNNKNFYPSLFSFELHQKKIFNKGVNNYCREMNNQ